MLECRRRSAVPCPVVPAAPARAAAMCTRQLAGARMCSCRACAGSWQCVVECASLGRSRVCSRARVGVCRAGAAERAHSRWKRFARSRVAELPDVAASARAPAMAHCSRKVFMNIYVIFYPHPYCHLSVCQCCPCAYSCLARARALVCAHSAQLVQLHRQNLDGIQS